MEDVNFRAMLPAHERYRYGELEPLERMAIDVRDMSYKEVQSVRAGVFSYGRYYVKKFKIKTKDGFIHIKRLV